LAGRQKLEDGRKTLSFLKTTSCFKLIAKRMKFIETKVAAMKLQGFNH